MNTSDDGVQHIKVFEGLRLEAYRDVVGVVTIGYGSTGKHVYMGMLISEDEAEALLRKDISRFEECVNAYVTADITQHQFDSLVSFAFNVGCGALKKSTLLRRLNADRHRDAADQLLRWDKAGGKRLAGLTRRRKMERELFLS